MLLRTSGDIVNGDILCSLFVVPMEVDMPGMALLVDSMEVVVVKPDSSDCESVVRDIICSHDWHSS